MNIKIATIITCFNRKEKTTSCLAHLFEATNNYNIQHSQLPIELAIFLTDDGCTDGTADAVKNICKGKNLHIIQGDGNCYWAGGMRLAWEEALKSKTDWDFYLLLNDDTLVSNEVFEELLATHTYCLKTFGKPGLYSGIICDINDESIITYGGKKFHSKSQGRSYNINPSETPQEVDMTNANILLIDRNVVDKIGIFYKGYIHGCADYDYSMTAKKNNFPTLTTAKCCGKCEYDHLSGLAEIKKLMSMSFKQRKRYVNFPTHSDKDYLLFVKRHTPKRFIFSWILRKIRVISPKIYYKICLLRKMEGY